MAGETTKAAGSDASRKIAPKFGGPLLNGKVLSHDYLTTQLELNDVLEIGYIPKGVTLIGFFAYEDDLDSNGTPTLSQKITVGSTDVATAIVLGRIGGASFIGIKPLTTTTATLVKVTNTAAAATAAAGNISLTPVYLAN
jgi:hypothetical protein